MKLYYFLNESNPKEHIDVYFALENLKKKGEITEYKIFPFLYHLKTSNNESVINKSFKEVREFEPDLILFSHTGNFKVGKSFFDEVKKLNPKVVIAYRDGDIYHPWYKPMSKEIFELINYCDVSFWCGVDYFTSKFINSYMDVRYVPSVSDPNRFKQENSAVKLFDVVLIGNFIRSKVPFKTYPGSNGRKKIASFLYNKLGDRFTVFGNGWNNLSFNQGPVAFDKQSDVYNNSRLTIAVNNLHAQYYFSNRLPIALASGIIIINNYEKGIEIPFSEINYKYFFKSFDEAWYIIKKLLDRSQEDLDAEAKVYKEYVINKMSMEFSLKYIIDVMKSYYYSKDRIKIPTDVENPWLGGITLKPYKEK